jgi:hypothetical protein
MTAAYAEPWVVLGVRRIPAFDQPANPGRVSFNDGAMFVVWLEIRPVSEVMRAVTVALPESARSTK